MRKVMMTMVVIAGAAGGAAGLTAGAAAAATVEVTFTGTVATVDDGNSGYAQNSYWNGSLAAGDAFTAKYVFDTTRGETNLHTDPLSGALNIWIGGGSAYFNTSPLLSATIEMGGRLIDLAVDYSGILAHAERGYSYNPASVTTYRQESVETTGDWARTTQLYFDIDDFLENGVDLPASLEQGYEFDLTTDYWSSWSGDDPLPWATGHFADYSLNLMTGGLDYYTYVEFNPTHVRVTP